MDGVDTLARSFGLVIAYLLPGIVGLYAVSYKAQVVRDWFSVAAEHETSVGAFLFVVLGSLAMGVFLSGLRCLTIDHVMPKKPADLKYGKRKDEHTEAAYRNIIADHYQYYQFYSNMLVAFAVLYAAWWHQTSPPCRTLLWTAAVMAVADVLLFLAARDALVKYDDKVKELLSDV